MNQSSPSIRTRSATEVPGIYCLLGVARARPDGWVRVDDVVHGEVPIGHIHVRMQDERVSSISTCGDRGVLGRDVAWIARESGCMPRAGMSAPAAAPVMQSRPPLALDEQSLRSRHAVAPAPSAKRRSARP